MLEPLQSKAEIVLLDPNKTTFLETQRSQLTDITNAIIEERVANGSKSVHDLNLCEAIATDKEVETRTSIPNEAVSSENTVRQFVTK